VVGAVAAIILVAEGDANLVEGDQTPVRDRDPVGVARRIARTASEPATGGLGVDHPGLLPDRSEAAQKARGSMT